MSKKWFCTRELKGLPGLPTSEAGVLRRAKSKLWKSRPRRGLGGGSEFHISSLPPETRLHIAQQEPNLAKEIEKRVPDKPARKSPGRKKRASVNSLGERLKKARTALGKSHSDMALSVGVSIGTWQNYEISKSVPGVDVLEAITHLGIDGNWLLTGKGHSLEKEKLLEIPEQIEQLTSIEMLKDVIEDYKSKYPQISNALSTAYEAAEDYQFYTGEKISLSKYLIIISQLIRERFYLGHINKHSVKNLFELTKEDTELNPITGGSEQGKSKKRKYRSFSSIDRLPANIINDIHRMATDPQITYENIVSYCNKHGHKVSKSAIGRYCFAFLKEERPDLQEKR